jgi:hypothetical protein
MDNLSPEAVLSIAGLIGAVAFGVRQISQAVATWIKTRADVKLEKAKAEADRIRAESAERATEAAQMSELIKLLSKQADTQQQTARILDEYKTELQQSRGTDERIEATLKEFNAETRALRLDLKSWPNTVDGTLAGLTTSIEALQATSGKEHAKVLELMADVHTKVSFIHQRVVEAAKKPDPPPTEPASAKPAKRDNVLDMDGAKADATVDLPVTTESKRDVA